MNSLRAGLQRRRDGLRPGRRGALHLGPRWLPHRHGHRRGQQGRRRVRPDGARHGARRCTANEGKSLVHLGLGASHRSPTDDTLTFSAKPEANLAPAYVSATVPAETLDLVGARGRLARRAPSACRASTRWPRSTVPRARPRDPDFAGYYVQASYFLTGEMRGYNKASGCFTRREARRRTRSAKEGGHGAWELGLRYSAIDLVDDGIDEGELTDVTAGAELVPQPQHALHAEPDQRQPRADLAGRRRHDRGRGRPGAVQLLGRRRVRGLGRDASGGPETDEIRSAIGQLEDAPRGSRVCGVGIVGAAPQHPAAGVGA